MGLISQWSAKSCAITVIEPFHKAVGLQHSDEFTRCIPQLFFRKRINTWANKWMDTVHYQRLPFNTPQRSKPDWPRRKVHGRGHGICHYAAFHHQRHLSLFAEMIYIYASQAAEKLWTIGPYFQPLFVLNSKEAYMWWIVHWFHIHPPFDVCSIVHNCTAREEASNKFSTLDVLKHDYRIRPQQRGSVDGFETCSILRSLHCQSFSAWLRTWDRCWLRMCDPSISQKYPNVVTVVCATSRNITYSIVAHALCFWKITQLSSHLL